MEEAIETIEYKGFKINIFRDEDARSPDDWGDENVFLVHYHRDFEVRRDELITEDELTDWYNGKKIEKQKQYHLFLTKTYIHSGVVLALEESGKMFPDERWDVSRCGCVLVSKKEVRTKKKAYQLAEGLVKTWNDYLSGSVYGYIIDGLEDSCWGFYGDFETSGIIEEAKVSVDYAIDKAMKKHGKKLKAYIKNNVSLEKRKTLKEALSI